MKIVLVSFKDVASGDLVIVEYADVRGGCHSVKHEVNGADTAASIASVLAHNINTEWMKEAFTADAKGDRLKIGCTDLVADKIVFRSHVGGNGGTKVEIEEF